MADPTPLEEKYRIAALALADLSEDDQPDSDLFHPWGRGGRLWQAGRYALIALRRRKDRVGDADFNHDEREALNLFAQYQADVRTLEAEMYLRHAHLHALKALRALIALRRSKDRVGDADFNDDEREALNLFAKYQEDIRTLEAETYLSHAHFHALKALRANYGLDLEWVGDTASFPLDVIRSSFDS
jgi:hypothetical protein